MQQSRHDERYNINFPDITPNIVQAHGDQQRREACSTVAKSALLACFASHLIDGGQAADLAQQAAEAFERGDVG